MKTQQTKKTNIPLFLRRGFLAFVVFCFIFSRFIMGLNVLVLKNPHLFADITHQDILVMINDIRQKNNLPILVENPKLDQAAYLKAQDMIDKNYFSHYSPQGISPWYWFDQVGYYYQYAGENLAMNFYNATEAFNAWMNSPLHRENILNRNYTETGIAVLTATIASTGERRTIIVQEFGNQFKNKNIVINKPISSNIKQENNITPATTQTKPFTSSTTIASTTTTSINTTTTTQPTTTSTIETEVLGQSQTNTSSLPPADVRVKEENIIKQTQVSEETRQELAKLEFQHAATSNHVTSSDWLKYHATSLIDTKTVQLLNNGSGIILIFLSTMGLFIVRKTDKIDYSMKKSLYARNAILGAMGAGFLIIQPTILFGNTIIPVILK